MTTTLVLFGRPASGKGTLSQHLAVERGFRPCSTGAAMRAWAEGPSQEQVALRATMAAGGYGSDALAVRIVHGFLAGLPGDVPGVILDGFPRNAAQLEAWLGMPGDPGIAAVVETPASLCRRRALGRLVCASCGWTDHQPATACENCGGRLQRRLDDLGAAAFERRLRDHDERVAPLIDAWASAALPLIRLDGTLGEDHLKRDLLDALDRSGALPARAFVTAS
jgi:adenylate kinase